MNETRSVVAGVGLVALAVLACGKKEETTTTSSSATAATSEATADPPADTAASTATASATSTTRAPSAAPKPVACAPGEAAAGTKGECLRVCTDSAPCKDDAETCEKSSFVSLNGSVKNVRVCMPGGGGPALRAVVAGGAWLNDQVPKAVASTAPSTPPAATGGGGVSDFTKPNGDGDCPKGFTNNQGGTCSRVCKSKADCHAPNTCVSLPVGSTKVCDEPGNAP